MSDSAGMKSSLKIRPATAPDATDKLAALTSRTIDLREASRRLAAEERALMAAHVAPIHSVQPIEVDAIVRRVLHGETPKSIEPGVRFFQVQRERAAISEA